MEEMHLEDVAAFVQRRASSERLRVWDDHIDRCDACRRLVSAVAMSPHVSIAPSSAVEATLARTIEPVTEEERALVQQRLGLLAAVAGILCAVSIVLSCAVVAALSPAPIRALAEYLARPHQHVMIGISVLALAAGRRLRGRHARISLPTLRAMDALGTVTLACALAATEALQGSDQRVALSTSLAVGHVLFVRSVAVPSSGLRTGLVSLLAASAAIGVEAAVLERRGVALGYAVGVSTLWLALSTLAAAIASHIIFGLRGEAAKLRVAGQYELHEKIGAGSMGEVFRATHRMMGRMAAIKFLPPGEDRVRASAFEEEVRQTARLRHPNTIAIFDYGRTSDGAFYYAMEHVEGIDLQRLVDATGPLPPGRVVHVLDQVLAALAEAHGLGLVHRDIKPANVMVLAKPSPDAIKVLDFGLVADVHRPKDAARVAGTPAYLAPERLDPATGADPSSDLYSVAALGYFLLTGTTVFRATRLDEMLRKHREEIPEPPGDRLGCDVSADLAAALLAGLAKDPSQRPPSAEAYRERFQSCAVEPWSASDARAWWAATGAVLRR
jgi:eukaryotic-like serine/threonine-protein kinase